MKGEKLGTWTESWAPSLWKGWVASAVFTVGVVLVLLQVLKDTPVSEGILALLRNKPPWPLWLIVLPSALAIFGLSAGFVGLLQVWDDRRISEAEMQLKVFADEKANFMKVSADEKANLMRVCADEKANLMRVFADEKADLKVEKNNIQNELRTKASLLENIKADYDVSERLRKIDPITGVPNYFAFSDDYAEWIKTGRIVNLCMILIDIDKLKWLNERNRDCADKVLKYFAQSTMNSMRRDEQMYKSEADDRVYNAELDRRTSEPKMYRHYQGGDEFFFVITGSVFDAIGFVNRLRDRVRLLYQPEIRSRILDRYLEENDAASFQLTFSAAVIGPGKMSVAGAFKILERAKHSPTSRLMVVFDSTNEEPSTHRVELENARGNVQKKLMDLQQQADSGDSDSKKMHETLSKEASRLDTNILALKKAEQLFSV
jgi:GGDEF domain-containing protein